MEDDVRTGTLYHIAFLVCVTNTLVLTRSVKFDQSESTRFWYTTMGLLKLISQGAFSGSLPPLPLFPSLPLFRSLYFSLALHYLNARNRLISPRNKFSSEAVTGQELFFPYKISYICMVLKDGPLEKLWGGGGWACEVQKNSRKGKLREKKFIHSE